VTRPCFWQPILGLCLDGGKLWTSVAGNLSHPAAVSPLVFGAWEPGPARSTASTLATIFRAFSPFGIRLAKSSLVRRCSSTQSLLKVALAAPKRPSAERRTYDFRPSMMLTSEGLRPFGFLGRGHQGLRGVPLRPWQRCFGLLALGDSTGEVFAGEALFFDAESSQSCFGCAKASVGGATDLRLSSFEDADFGVCRNDSC
jgi:hypothetical protein